MKLFKIIGWYIRFLKDSEVVNGVPGPSSNVCVCKQAVACGSILVPQHRSPFLKKGPISSPVGFMVALPSSHDGLSH